jgi:cysteine-rich repeat protein
MGGCLRPRAGRRRAASRWGGLLLVGTLATAGPASAAILYGTTGGSSPSDLYTIDPATGNAASIGPTGEALTGLAVHPITRVLYGVASTHNPDGINLYTVDPGTGAASLVGSLGALSNAVADIAFAADGTLFGWSEASDDLVTIDLVTGLATPVADSELSTAGSGLAFDAAGTLFFAGNFDAGPGPDLVTIDPATGLLDTPIGNLGIGDNERINALTFHPASGVLFGSEKTDTGWELVTIDPATAAVSSVGPSVSELDALAFAPLCGDGEVDAPWEACDDGNTVAEDGCSGDCSALEACGDGVLQVGLGEECDDGNTVDGDGCSATCALEPCRAAPRKGCVAASSGSLNVSEKKPGKEKLKAVLAKFQSPVAQPDLGDPVNGDTRVDLCVYDATDGLAVVLTVDEGGQTCGPKDKPCWKALSTKGYAYGDPEASASGVKKISEKGGAAGKGKLQVQAANNEKKSQDDLPTGIAPALQGAGQATLQLVTSDGACFEAVLTTVKKADGVDFKAKAP